MGHEEDGFVLYSRALARACGVYKSLAAVQFQPRGIQNFMRSYTCLADFRLFITHDQRQLASQPASKPDLIFHVFFSSGYRESKIREKRGLENRQNIN